MTTPAEHPKKRRKSRLSEREWAEATTLWETGEANAPALAKRFDRYPRTFLDHFSKRKIKFGCRAKEHAAAIAAEVAKKATDDSAILATRIRETKEEHYKMAAGLAKLTWQEVVDARAKSEPIANRIHNLKALDAAMTILKKAREERFSVLGLDRDDFVASEDLPELVISELTAEQIEQMRASEEEDVGELVITGTQDLPEAPETEADEDGIVEER